MFQPLAKAPSMKSVGRASRNVNSIVCLSRTLMASTVENNGVRGRLCRKIAFSRQNPKIVYWKINDLRVQTFLFSVICDRAAWATKPFRREDQTRERGMHIVCSEVGPIVELH